MSGSIAKIAWRIGARAPACRSEGTGPAALRWIEYDGIQGNDCHIAHLALPAGQRCAVTSNGMGGTVLAGVEGCINVDAGGVLYRLNERDLLALPAGLPYALHNISETRTAFICQMRAHRGATTSATDGDQVQHVSYETSLQQMSWDLHLADAWGYRRGSGPYVAPAGLRGHMVSLPFAQSSPWHHAPRDLYFLGLDGMVAFEAAGQWTHLAYMDLLYLRAGTPYRYVNAAAEDAFFLSIGGAAERGAKGVYYAEDPGWPLRADAKVFSTNSDPYADLRGQA